MTSHGSLIVVDVDFLENKEAFDHWYAQMPDYRKEKIDRIKPESGKRASLGAGIALSRMLCDKGIEDVSLFFEDNGKPFIQGATDLYFNLSHSGNKAVCAFSDAQVGVDIEKVKAFSDRLVKKIYNVNEIKYIKYHSNDREDEDKWYTRLWTMKESYMKYSGKGLSMDPARIFIDLEDGCKAYYDGDSSLDVFFSGYELSGYQLTVCSQYKDFSDGIKMFDGRVI